jgi:hypothetical protein
MKKTEVDKMYDEYATGGLVSKNAMSDYFLASSGKMTEVEFVGKHKMSTLEFEKQFAEDNNVDITGTEKLSEVATGPEGTKMDYTKKPKTMDEGGIVGVDPVSGNDIPIGSTAEEVRDDIPAMLSKNEYVVPADVLKYFGVNFFEKLRMKAKQGMLEMEADGRTGGEPIEGPRDETVLMVSSSEEPTMLAGGGFPGERSPMTKGTFPGERLMMAEGGFPGERSPMTKGTFPGERITMAEGGLLGEGESSVPRFNPADFAIPGFSGVGSSGSTSPAYEYKEYTGPGGATQMILFLNGIAAQDIPAGFVLTSLSPTAPVVDPAAVTAVNTNGSDRNDGSRQLPNKSERTQTKARSPLADLDFTDTESVDEWAAEKLESTQMQGLGLLPGVAGLAGRAAGTGVELRDIASVSAAARYYSQELGDQESSNRLMGLANKARENLGFVGGAFEGISNGEGIFKNYMESLVQDSSSSSAETPEVEAPVQGQATVDEVLQQQAARDSQGDRDDQRNRMSRSGIQYETGTSDDGKTTVSRAIGNTAPVTSPRPQGRDKGGLVTKPQPKAKTTAKAKPKPKSRSKK